MYHDSFLSSLTQRNPTDILFDILYAWRIFQLEFLEYLDTYIYRKDIRRFLIWIARKKRKNTNSKIKNSYIIAWLIFKVISLAYKKYFVLTFTYCHIYNLIFLKYNVLPKLNSTLEKRSPKQSHKNICERQVNETED